MHVVETSLYTEQDLFPGDEYFMCLLSVFCSMHDMSVDAPHLHLPTFVMHLDVTELSFLAASSNAVWMRCLQIYLLEQSIWSPSMLSCHDDLGHEFVAKH